MSDSKHYSEEIEQFLSLERFERYLIWANGDRQRAIELYTLNTKLSECLYLPLQTLEIALRNRIHAVMSERFGEDWLHHPGAALTPTQIEQVTRAITDIERDRKAPTAGRTVAALTFGFWTAMLGPAHDTLWQKTLNRIAQRENGKGLRRKDFSGPLKPIRDLRNRIAHHEPILEWHLPTHYRNVLQLTGWLSPAAAAWCREHSRFDEVHPATPIELHRSAT